MRLTKSPFRANTFLTTPRTSYARGWTLAAICTGLLATFQLDRATEVAPVQHLYYLPIILAGVVFGTRGGLIAALAATALYHVANPHLLSLQYEQLDLVQIALFLGAGVITAKVTRDARRLQRLAMTDDLTGLHNLRSFEARLKALVDACRNERTPLSLLVLDVDRLKSLNDTHGHLAGAEAVRTVGQILGTHLPADAVACRYGGDEFVVALPACDVTSARQIADALGREVRIVAPTLAAMPFPAGTLSISVGLACSAGDYSGEALFRAADAALYEAKRGGRDRVALAPDVAGALPQNRHNAARTPQ